jgi:hypothetical protein
MLREEDYGMRDARLIVVITPGDRLLMHANTSSSYRRVSDGLQDSRLSAQTQHWELRGGRQKNWGCLGGEQPGRYSRTLTVTPPVKSVEKLS